MKPPDKATSTVCIAHVYCIMHQSLHYAICWEPIALDCVELPGAIRVAVSPTGGRDLGMARTVTLASPAGEVAPRLLRDPTAFRGVVGKSPSEEQHVAPCRIHQSVPESC